mmetsp:Transcript_12337/g.14524  ORF Transcript_12337/g.14524 Transcript_12337/m.14524 type:complete len:199 (+) Transcript_12337:82-678(+)|eukprot:CAMPEP_0198263518 /NCGR_PEP_ID=MMETSP1447-20131203/12281_1 /TAXON_ID=420782 /ORGANISM="Chaetoceros dichaeta, Strain CCMP1751" /LENGTH=198 /DNA_ID=CAMNT_0043952133 /DNA_START=35 /DNA_END=631 /DNA_ORIENTATION=+
MMRFQVLGVLLTSILSSFVIIPVSSLAPTSGVGAATTTKKDRRQILASLLSVGTSSLVAGAAILQPTVAEAAVDVSSLQPATATTTPATGIDTDIFLGGTYIDPQNHPGGTRTIELAGTGFAGYRLITVKGGGGRGEPKSYELPGMIFNCPGNNQRGGKQCISIDFTPKGGPRDFQGYWDEEKQGIRFVLDNNFWPKQ